MSWRVLGRNIRYSVNRPQTALPQRQLRYWARNPRHSISLHLHRGIAYLAGDPNLKKIGFDFNSYPVSWVPTSRTVTASAVTEDAHADSSTWNWTPDPACLCEADLDAYAEMCADPEVMRYIGNGQPLSFRVLKYGNDAGALAAAGLRWAVGTPVG